MGNLKTEIVNITPFEQNCTLMWDDDSKNAVVIDPGGEIEKIIKRIKDNNINVKEIWLTHGHIDHAGGAMELKEKLKVKIIGPHKNDEPLLSGLEEQSKMFGLNEKVQDVIPDQWLEEGDEVHIENHKFEVMHCPGHAPGHVVFYNQKLGFAHVGDVLFAGSVGRTDLPLGNHDELMKSIKNKLMKLPEETKFICGHGPTSSIGQEKNTNPFLQ